MSRLQNLYNIAIGSFYILPFGITLIVLALSSAKAESRRAVTLLAWGQLSIPLIIILLGGLFRCPGVLDCPRTEWLAGLAYVLFLLQPPIGLYILWEVRRYKAPILIFSFIQLVLSLAVLFDALMSITGDYL